MKTPWKKSLLAIGTAAALLYPPTDTKAQSSEALVDALVSKGILTEQEGEDIKADLTKEFKSTGGGKLDVNSSVKKLKLYGDFRGRYEWQESKRTANGFGEDKRAENWRPRVRVRVGADYELADGMKAGLRLATAGVGAGDGDQRATNQTLDGFFNSGEIVLDKAWAEIDFVKYFTDSQLWFDSLVLGAGVFENPLKRTNLTWDGDINPNGAWQTLTKKFSIDDTEGQFNFVTGQWIVDDNVGAGFVGTAGGNNQDLWMMPFQLSSDFTFKNKDKFTFAATQYLWTNLEGPGSEFAAASSPNRGLATMGQGGRASGQNSITEFGSLNTTALYAEYRFHDVPWDKDIPFKIWSEFLYNMAVSKEQTGGQIGFQLGEAKKRGTWEIASYFNYLERNAWYDGFTDSDFSNGSVNRFGYVARASYAFTDYATLNFTWIDADEMVSTKGITATTAPAVETSRVQLDVVVKF